VSVNSPCPAMTFSRFATALPVEPQVREAYA
jgi:hypothetical protein